MDEAQIKFLAKRLAEDKMKEAGREFEEWERKSLVQTCERTARVWLVFADASAEYIRLKHRGAL